MGVLTSAINTFKPVSRDLYSETLMPSYDVAVSTILSKFVPAPSALVLAPSFGQLMFGLIVCRIESLPEGLWVSTTRLGGFKSSPGYVSTSLTGAWDVSSWRRRREVDVADKFTMDQRAENCSDFGRSLNSRNHHPTTSTMLVYQCHVVLSSQTPWEPK